MAVTAEAVHREEIANAITHGVGALASAAAGAVLVTIASLHGSRLQQICAIVFGTSLVLLYTASTLYHAIPSAIAKRRLKVFDHCAIYTLIAGTYTPFALIGLRGTVGWWLFGVAWGLALIGIVFKLFFTGRFKLFSTLVYIGMGWMALFAIKPMMMNIPLPSLIWLLAGGVAYTAGTVFYHNERLRYSHAVWHLFVLAGSACHFIAVMSQVVPAL
ncbi:MAG: hemolysin III family protein [Gemmatimonadaceae bacterium]|nr:hemolysin III family protein [Gemmatimonadaceae bacterium]